MIIKIKIEFTLKYILKIGNRNNIKITFIKIIIILVLFIKSKKNNF